MGTKRKLALILLCAFCLVLVTGCVDQQTMDQNWLEHAHADITTSIDPDSFNWILIFGGFCLFLIGYSMYKDDWTGALIWLGLMILGFYSFLEITNVYQVLGKGLWPEGYALSNITNKMGWQLPWPEDAVWTSPFAYIFTDLIPYMYNQWQLVLLIVHLALLIAIGMSRNIRPLWSDLTFVAMWATSPYPLMWSTFLVADQKRAAPEVLKYFLEGIYVGGIYTIFLFWVIAVPLVVLVFSLALPLYRGQLQPQWGPTWKNRNFSADVRKLTQHLSFEDAAALFATFFTEVPEPKRQAGSGSPSTAEFPARLPPPSDGGFDDYGDYGPQGSGPPSPSPGGTGPTEPDVIDTEETSKGHFSPIMPSPEPEGEFPEQQGKKFAPSLSELGHAAKTIAPFATAVNPEAGLVIGATGALLDRPEKPDQKGDQKSEFPPATRAGGDAASITPHDSSTVSRGTGEFADISRKKEPSPLGLESDAEEDMQDFPPLRRREQ